MTVAQFKELSSVYLDRNRMIGLVVGDAKTQLPRLKELGFGEPIVRINNRNFRNNRKLITDS